eukprot:323285-Chlamydomonas_euryale.AAC.1
MVRLVAHTQVERDGTWPAAGRRARTSMRLVAHQQVDAARQLRRMLAYRLVRAHHHAGRQLATDADKVDHLQ